MFHTGTLEGSEWVPCCGSGAWGWSPGPDHSETELSTYPLLILQLLLWLGGIKLLKRWGELAESSKNKIKQKNKIKRHKKKLGKEIRKEYRVSLQCILVTSLACIKWVQTKTCCLEGSGCVREKVRSTKSYARPHARKDWNSLCHIKNIQMIGFTL